jgi:hypothetical protein
VGIVQSHDLPTLAAHAIEKRTTAATEIQQSAITVPRQGTAFETRAPEQFGKTSMPNWPSRFSRYSLMGAVILGVELADRRCIGARAREVKSALIAANDGEPKSGRAAAHVRRLEHWRTPFAPA